jgi:hypothetical protein
LRNAIQLTSFQCDDTDAKLAAAAAADNDGLISFEEFLVSYAKPKPIGKNMLIMAINTAAIYLILQAPFLDVMLKVGSHCTLG